MAGEIKQLFNLYLTLKLVLLLYTITSLRHRSKPLLSYKLSSQRQPHNKCVKKKLFSTQTSLLFTTNAKPITLFYIRLQ